MYAEDLDQTTEFNRISFSIVDGSFGSFIIRSFAEEGRGYRGDITVDPDIELDYESVRNQTLRIEAADLEQNHTEAVVKVNVLDVNDERPEFRPTEPVSMKENTNNTETIGRFTAYDRDGNHSLVYELESIKCRCNGSMVSCNSFNLDATGEVRVNPNSLMDYEQCDQVLLEAQVVDQFTEKGENNSAKTGQYCSSNKRQIKPHEHTYRYVCLFILSGQMVIYIEDVNDNAPEFIYSDSIFGEFMSESALECSYLWLVRVSLCSSCGV